jgi:hypothetical protein
MCTIWQLSRLSNWDFQATEYQIVHIHLEERGHRDPDRRSDEYGKHGGRNGRHGPAWVTAPAPAPAAVRELARERAVLVISHRLANVVDASCIYVLRDGRVVGAGTHGELLANSDRLEGLNSHC